MGILPIIYVKVESLLLGGLYHHCGSCWVGGRRSLMRLIYSCLWASYFITSCVAYYTGNSTRHISFIGSPTPIVTPSTYPVKLLASRYTNPAYLTEFPNDIYKKAKNIAQSLQLDKYSNLISNLTYKLKDFFPFNLYNCNVPFQSFVYYSNLSIYLADSFIFDGLFAGLFELRGNAISTNDEGYRIITSLFIHRDWPHLAMNMLSFSTISPMVIKATGPIKAMIIYIISGIIANYVSYVYHVLHEKGIHIYGEVKNDQMDGIIDISKKNYETSKMFKELAFPKYLFLHFKSLIKRLIYGKPNYHIDKNIQTQHSFTSRGASGAIYGLHGAYMIYRWNREGAMAIPSGFFLPNRIWEIILSSILNSFGENQVDTVAHVSGFISGMILGLINKLYT